MNELITAADIAQHYSACGDSVALLRGGKPADMSGEEWALCIKRNREHLIIMRSKDFWTTEDMTDIELESRGNPNI